MTKLASSHRWLPLPGIIWIPMLAVGSPLPAQVAPAIEYSTYYGSHGTDDCDAVALDRPGSTYLGCHSDSPNLPGSGEHRYVLSGGMDAFVVKLGPRAQVVSYIAQLGGSKWDAVQGLTTDGVGNVYAVGSTYSADFPTNSDAHQSVFGGKSDAFVAKLDPEGNVVWSTYFGGSEDEDGRGIVLDSTGNAHVVGRTASTDLATTPNALQQQSGGGTDAFVATFDPGGRLLRSTYLGGTGEDIGFAIALDADGRLYISGTTNSVDLPLRRALHSSHFGADDVFVSILNTAGSDLEFSTYIGGSGADRGYGIALTPSGDVILLGHTTSPDLPTTLRAFQGTFGGEADGFVARLDIMKKETAFLTYLGGSGADRPRALVVDSVGAAWIVGQTDSSDFPAQRTGGTYDGSEDDAFLTKLDASGAASPYSLVTGGKSQDAFEGIALASDGSLTVVGLSRSPDFPTLEPMQAEFVGGRFDVVLTRLLRVSR